MVASSKEQLPKKAVILPENQIKETHDYSDLLPVLTLVWMVQDNLGFDDDFKSFCLAPEDIIFFLRDVGLWKNNDITELLNRRNELVKLLENNTKELQFLQKNQLIYIFQKNIVKNKTFKKYYPWFELAENTLKKISDKFAYQEYEKDAILKEVIRRLKKEIENPEEIKYIGDYDEFIDSVKRYDQGLLLEGHRLAEHELFPLLEIEKQRAEQERLKLINSVRQMKIHNIPIEIIIQASGINREEIEKI